MNLALDATNFYVIFNMKSLILIFLVFMAFGTFPLIFRAFAWRQYKVSRIRKDFGYYPVKTAGDESQYNLHRGISNGFNPFTKLGKGSYYLVLSNITNMIIGAAFWFILAKMVSPDTLGQAMVVISLATSVIGFAGYGVQVTVSKYMSEYNARDMAYASRNVLRLGLRITMIVSCAAAISIVLLSQDIASQVYHYPSLSILLTLAGITFLPSGAILSTLTAAFLGSQRMEHSALTNLVYQIARLALAVILVLYGLNGFGIIAAVAGASLIALFVAQFLQIPRVLRKVSDQVAGQYQTRHIMKFAGLNYVAVGMDTLSGQLGVIILGMRNFESASFFGLSNLMANIVGGALIAVSRAILPTASEEWAKGNKTGFKRVFSTAIRISLLITGFGFLIFMIEPSYILGLLSKPYIEASGPLRVLVVSSIISSLAAVTMSMLNATGRPSSVAKVQLISSASTIAMTSMLTPMAGLEGAAVAMLVGSVCSLVLSAAILKREEQLTISINSVIKPIISILVGLVIGYALLVLWNNVILAITLALVSYATFAIMFRAVRKNELKLLLTIMRHTMRP